MKSVKTVISTQTQPPPVPKASVESRHGPRRVPRRARVPDHPVAQPEQAAPPDQPFLSGSVTTKDDPFSCPPPIYDPDADFIVDSAQNEIRELLSPEPDAPPPET